MKAYFKGALIVGFAVALPLIVALAPGWTAVKEKGVLVVAGGTPVTNLDPASSGMSCYTMNFRNLYQSLLRYKRNSSELEGDLAKSWSVSKDGLVYTFKLRDNVKWHKGFGKVTAQDVKFSIDRIKDPKTASPFMGELNTIKEVKALDDQTVEIDMKSRDVAFLLRCVIRPMPIVCKKAVEQYGAEFPRNPIGSGPYVFQSMSREEVVMTANKEYFEGAPKIEKVIYKTIPDSDTQVMGLIKGEIDYTIEIPSEQTYVDRVKSAGLIAKGIDHGGYHQLLLNTAAEPLNDVRVRRAIAHAINKDEIIKNLYVPGAVEKLNTLVPKGYWGYTEEGIPQYNFDPQKAKALLAEAGYPNGFDITFDSSNHPAYIRLAQTIQDQLTKVGIRVKLDVTDEPTWLKKVTGGTARMSLFLPSRAPDADTILTRFFHSSGFSPGYNLSHYGKTDKELDEARGELNTAKRSKMYQDIQKKLMEDVPAVPLFNIRDVAAYRTGLGEIPDRDPIWGIDYRSVSLRE